MASSDRTNSSISARLVPVFNALSDAASVAEYYGPYCPHLFIVITGASVGGIGFEVAQTLSKYGAQIFLCCHTQQACETATHKIKGKPAYTNFIIQINQHRLYDNNFEPFFLY